MFSLSPPNETFGFPIEVVWDAAPQFDNPPDDDIEPGPALVHAYCVRPNGTLVDAAGTLDPDEAIHGFGDCREPMVCRLDAQGIADFQSRIGLYSAGEEIAARSLILAHRPFYADDRGRIEDA